MDDSRKIDYGLARNNSYTRSEVPHIEGHDERKRETYTNCDVVNERSRMNVHFKTCAGTYLETIDSLVKTGVVTKRGQRADAKLMDEFMIAVNSQYFLAHGGYEYAEEFYRAAYDFCVQEAGGEVYILAATMHADERNKALTEQYGQDVWHYHLHVPYIPVVPKEIKYSARYHDKTLVGKVRKVEMQISHSKKWKSAPCKDENGNVLRNKDGNILYQYSYSDLQDRFIAFMIARGFNDIERGVKGSKQVHLETTEYKRLQEKKRAEEAAAMANTLSAEVEEKEVELRHIERQIVAGQAAVKEELSTLSQIKDDAEYFNFADRCREVVQWIVDRLTAFINRDGWRRNREAEKSLITDLQRGLALLFDQLRQLCGYEYRTNIAPDDCESMRIVAEVPSLDAQIQAASAAPKAYCPSGKNNELNLS